KGQHGSRRLRNVRGRRDHSRPDLAGGPSQGAAEGRLPREPDRRSRPPRAEAAARGKLMLDAFREVWAADFEFVAAPGGRPEAVSLVARELKTGRPVRLWRDQFGTAPPYPTDPDCLFIAYYASAELGCHLALGWPLPARVLDLYTEF